MIRLYLLVFLYIFYTYYPLSRKLQCLHNSISFLLFLNPSIILITVFLFNISSISSLNIFPKLIIPRVSKQHGTIVPSTSIPIWPTSIFCNKTSYIIKVCTINYSSSQSIFYIFIIFWVILFRRNYWRFINFFYFRNFIFVFIYLSFYIFCITRFCRISWLSFVF